MLGSRIAPSSFAFHVTYTCPLACAHCCFSSSPANRDRLEIDQILETIEAIDTRTIKLIAFTGGEPTLLGAKLTRAVAAAANRGLRTRVVTSAHFGTSMERAQTKLTELREAGLDELTISWDDYHEEFVEFERIHNAFWVAHDLGLTVAVNIVQGTGSKWTGEKVREELGLPADSPAIVVESAINKTGRAEEALADQELRPARSLGPCPYVLTGPTLSAKNKLLACCGVIPDTEELTIDPDFEPEHLDEALERAQSSPLYKWLHTRGPYAIMKWISEEYGVPIADAEEIGGNCEACKCLFENPELTKRLPDALAAKAEEIDGELSLLDALDVSRTGTLYAMWTQVFQPSASNEARAD